MNNEKKELNSSEMDQVNGGSLVSKNSKIIKRQAKTKPRKKGNRIS